MKTDFAAFDTEDDSRERVEKTGSGLGKRVTQIAARWPDGSPFLNRGDKREFQRALLRQAAAWQREHDGPLRCYAHNVQYDLGNVFDDVHDLDLRFVASRLISARWRNVTFLDSFNIWPMRLAKLGGAFGLEKLKFSARGRAYVLRDVEIVREAMAYAERFAQELGLERCPTTLGGLCVKAWQAGGGENFQCVAEFAREAYLGGRVELFSAGGRGRFHYCDINSLYPHVMTFPFPDDWLEQPRAVPAAGWGVARAVVRVPRQRLAPLPCRREDGSIWYPWGDLAGAWTWHELRNAVQHHGAKILRVEESWGCQGASCCYAAFVREAYERRLTTKTDAEKLMLKLLMNNLYGRLGATGRVTRSLWLKPRDFGPDDFYIGDGVPYGEKHLVDVLMPPEEHVNWLHAAYVTSYARLELLSWLRRVPGADLCYCDTDSIIFRSHAGPPPFPIGKGLGEMKLEGTASRCLTFAPKVYVFGCHAKAKGVKKTRERALGRSWNPAVDFIRSGSAECFLPFKLREHVTFYDEQTDAKGRVTLPANSRPLSVWRRVTKSMVKRYDKKELHQDGEYWPRKNPPLE